MKIPSFGDNVRVLDTEDTRQRGLAGLIGQVYGVTTPSVTHVEVIGELLGDVALNIHFDERNEELWLSPNLVAFIDHAPGTEVGLDAIPKKWIRNEAGEWIEYSTDSNQQANIRKPWWKVW